MKRSKLFAITLQSKIRYIFLAIAVIYNLLLGLYLKDFLVLSPILLTFYLLSALPTLFLLVDIRSKGMRVVIFILLSLIIVMDVIYLFRCRRLILFPTMVSLLIEVIYFGAFVEQTRKDGFLTKIYVLAVTGIVILNLNSAYNFIYKPEAPYLDNGRDTLWDTQTVELADEICTDCETDAEKARAFQNWIVSNFEYDFEADPFIQYFDVSKTIRTRKGLCFDFAHLFAAFCRSQNIPCYVIDGTSYTDPTDAHTWNSVYYDGAWWDVDNTSDIMRKQSGQELYSFRMLESASASDRYFYITKIY